MMRYSIWKPSGADVMEKQMDTIALITGASSGLGKEISITLAKKGYTLIVTSNETEDLEKVYDEIHLHSRNSTHLAGDITDRAFLKELADHVEVKYGRCDILVNNVGILIPDYLGRSDPAKWDKVLEINLTAAFSLSNYLIPLMDRNGIWPLIINISSISGIMGSPFCASYVASKHGLIGLTEAINEEFRLKGRVRATAICPSTINTPSMWKINTPGITPRSDEAILEPAQVADLIEYVCQVRDHIFLPRIVINRRKPNDSRFPPENL